MEYNYIGSLKGFFILRGNILAPPNITIAPLDQTVRQFTEVELTCVVSGVPLAQVEWLVDMGEGLEAITVDNNSVQLETSESDTEVMSTLTLLTIEPSQTGTYVCSANNSLGQDTAQADIIVFGKARTHPIIQWNLSVTVTLGTMLGGCYTEVACL